LDNIIVLSDIKHCLFETRCLAALLPCIRDGQG
jgi:hypothetical protein